MRKVIITLKTINFNFKCKEKTLVKFRKFLKNKKEFYILHDNGKEIIIHKNEIQLVEITSA